MRSCTHTLTSTLAFILAHKQEELAKQSASAQAAVDTQQAIEMAAAPELAEEATAEAEALASGEKSHKKATHAPTMHTYVHHPCTCTWPPMQVRRAIREPKRRELHPQ